MTISQQCGNSSSIQYIGDGSCLFSAVAFSLIVSEQAILQQDSNFFTDKGLQTSYLISFFFSKILTSSQIRDFKQVIKPVILSLSLVAGIETMRLRDLRNNMII